VLRILPDEGHVSIGLKLPAVIDDLLVRARRGRRRLTAGRCDGHALRHTYGMDLAMRGVPLSVIQQLMGHDDPRTTSIYTVAHAEGLSAALADAGVL
jgi:site-specific recombinase XerD